MMHRSLLALIALMALAPLRAEELDGATILARATEAAGGADWANARSLVLRGKAEFWGSSGAASRSTADSYVMYRVYDPQRQAAHDAEGKVRIIAGNAGKLLWTVGFDGQTTWTDKGITPKAEADAFWASNFGFGIIRHALQPGFKAERVADNLDGRHRLLMVRLTDPAGAITLFGIDARSYAIRYMGFMTPRGWHVRTYDGFFHPRGSRWLQSRSVTLYYNGVKQNVVTWESAQINTQIDPALFAPPATLPTPSTDH